MNGKVQNNNRPPRWFMVVLWIMLLPLLAYPWFWSHVEAGGLVGVDYATMRPLVYMFPIYVLLSQYMSYVVYAERRVLAWMLQGVLFVMYALCIWLVLC